MMKWRLFFSKDAEADLAGLDRSSRRRVIERLEWLLDNFGNIPLLPLHGSWKGFFKLRAGDIRIIYTVRPSEKIIRIAYIEHRDKIYKRHS